jgi:hypothetical protein
VSAEREALFDPQVHLGLRLLGGIVGAGMLAVALRFCWLAWTDRKWPLVLALPVVLALLALVYGSVFRTEKVYGLPAGVEVQREGRWITIPWPRVGPPARAWWSFNPVFRVVALPVQGGRPILFFAARNGLERLEALRAKAPSASQ